jgi:predicted RNA-binding protein
MSGSKSYWLLVERLENWNFDQRNGFRQFGLPDHKKTLGSEIKKGDLLIFYVSTGVSSFADIREAQADGVSKMPRGEHYDTAFPLRITTQPYLILSREQWVPMKLLADRISITAGKADWRHVVRNSLRRLSSSDAEAIIAAMQQSAGAGGTQGS